MNVDLLLEKYLNTIRQSKYNIGDYEVFINPTRRELIEVSEGGYGYRFLFDFKNKKSYAISTNAFHMTLMNELSELPDFDSFWYNGKHPYILTGDVNIVRQEPSSDALYADVYKRFQVQEMLDMDWSWIPKSFPIKKIQDMLEEY